MKIDRNFTGRPITAGSRAADRSPQAAVRPVSEVIAPIIMADGRIADLAALTPADIDFPDMAASLSRQVRWSGRHKPAGISIAQHSVMGADALFRETGDAVLAGYFVLHDGHEYLLGDVTRPVAGILQHHIDRILGSQGGDLVRRAIKAAKDAIDLCVWKAAGLPTIGTMPLYQRLVSEMDERMCFAEAKALYGSKTPIPLVDCTLPPARLTESFAKPWPAMKGEEAFLDRLDRYLGIVARP